MVDIDIYDALWEYGIISKCCPTCAYASIVNDQYWCYKQRAAPGDINVWGFYQSGSRCSAFHERNL